MAVLVHLKPGEATKQGSCDGIAGDVSVTRYGAMAHDVFGNANHRYLSKTTLTLISRLFCSKRNT